MKEATFGTTPALATGQAIELITCDMGPAEVGVTRAKKDKTEGRGMTNQYIEGHVAPIAFSATTSVKSRATATTVPKESDLYEAAGLIETVGGANVAYALTANPTPVGLSILKALGTGATCYAAEQGRGGCMQSLAWSGGDQELTLKVGGAFAGKYHLGYVDSVTFAAATGDPDAVSVEYAHRLALGYYQVESEVVLLTAINYATGALTTTRAQLATSGAAHAAKPMYPHVPTLTLAGSPISEANFTVTIDGVAILATGFEVALETGLKHRPAEAGSKYVQGLYATRYNVKPTVKMLLHREDVALIGKATQRKNCAITIVAGTGAGSIVTFSMPQCEARFGALPDVQNDAVAISLPFECRDSSAANDMFTLVCT